MMDDEDEDEFGNYGSYAVPLWGNDATTMQSNSLELDANQGFGSLEQQEATAEVDPHCWESTDQQDGLNEQPGTDHPKMKDWKDANDGRMIVTFDRARVDAWRQGKQELSALRAKIAPHADEYFDWICKLLFGKQSALFSVLSNSVSINSVPIDYSQFCLFMATFFAASASGKALSDLEGDPRYDTSGLMSTGEYNQFWKAMSVDAGDEIYSKALWTQVQEAFNHHCGTLFIEGYKQFVENLLVALDDDKVHLASSANANWFGLKRVQHVKANRKGLVFDTAAYPCSGFPLNVSAQHKVDTSNLNYKRMAKQMFGQRTGDGLPDLQGVTFASDRGYWNPNLFYDFLLRGGANCIGTVKRAPWYPFSYVQGKQSPDKDKYGRDIVAMEGFKSVWNKSAKFMGTRINAVCYRSGTGTAVSLAMNTFQLGRHMDFNFTKPADARWYFDETISQEDKDRKAFFSLFDDNKVEFQDLIRSCKVRPRTIGQTDSFWMVDRSFCATSSTVNGIVKVRAGDITDDHDLRQSYAPLLRYIGQEDWFPNEEPEEEEGAAPAVDDVGGDAEPAPTQDARIVTRIIAKLEAGGNVMAEQVQEFKTGWDKLPEGLVAEFVRQIPKAAARCESRTLLATQKQLLNWSACPRLESPYFFYSAPEEKEELKRFKNLYPHLDINLSDFSRQADRQKKLGELLLWSSTQEPPVAPVEETGQDGNPLPPANPLMIQVFTQGYLKPLAADRKKFAQAGHENEKPMLRKVAGKNIVGVQIKALYNAPMLVDKSPIGMPHMKDNSDSIAIVSDGGLSPDEVMPIEIKSRVTNNTIRQENYRLLENLELEEASSTGKPIYRRFSALNPELLKWVPAREWLMQLLHHVVAFESSKGLLLVGTTQRIIYGLIIDFPDELKSAYIKVVQDVYEVGLSWAWKPTLDNLPVDEIKAVLQCDTMKNRKLDFHSFSHALHVWRCLNVDNRTVKFPLPPCLRLIPFTHSFWNIAKGGSDTISKLMWNCLVRLPAAYVNPQTTTLGRLFVLYGVIVHRVIQVQSANPDLDTYPSLNHYRNSRNKHAFHTTLREVSAWFVDQHKKDNCPPSSPTASQVPGANIPETPQPAHTTRHANVIPYERSQGLVSSKTGATPMKGRPAFHRNQTSVARKDEERLDRCPGHLVRQLDPILDHNGQVVGYEKTKRLSNCSVCGMSGIAWCCALCKRFYCASPQNASNTIEKIKKSVVEREKLKAKMERGENAVFSAHHNRVAFLDGKVPSEALRCRIALDDDNDQVNFEDLHFQNTCFHMRHRGNMEEMVAILSESRNRENVANEDDDCDDD